MDYNRAFLWAGWLTSSLFSVILAVMLIPLLAGAERNTGHETAGLQLSMSHMEGTGHESPRRFCSIKTEKIYIIIIQIHRLNQIRLCF